MSIKAERNINGESDTDYDLAQGVSGQEIEGTSDTGGNDIRLPDYYPLHRNTRGNLLALNLSEQDATDGHIRHVQTQMMSIIDDYIANTIEMNAQRVVDGTLAQADFKEEQTAIYESKTLELANQIASKAYGLVERKNTMFEIFKEVKAETINSGNDVEPLTLDNLGTHRVNGQSERQVYDYYTDLVSDRNNFANEEVAIDLNDPRMLEFREKIFVTINPTTAVPNLKIRTSGAEEEEELEVAGGVVDLHCQISKKLMTKPKKVTPCGHVFDMQSLQDQARNSVRKCAECGRLIDGMVDDEVMKLRLKAYQRDSKIEELLKEISEAEYDVVI